MSSISSLTALFYTQQTQAASAKKTQSAAECASTSGQNPYGSAINISLSSSAQSLLGGGNSSQQVGDVITPDPISDTAFGYNASPSAGGPSTFELILASFTSSGGTNTAGVTGAANGADGVTDASDTADAGGLSDIFKQIEQLFATLQNQMQGNTQQASTDDDTSQQASVDPQQTGLSQPHHHHHHHAQSQPQDGAAAVNDPSAAASAGTSTSAETTDDVAATLAI